MFRAALYEKTGVNPAEELKIKRKLEKLVAVIKIIKIFIKK